MPTLSSSSPSYRSTAAHAQQQRNASTLEKLKRQSEHDHAQYHVERSIIDISALDRIAETLEVRPPSQRVRVTHSATIKRSYTPLWEKYRRSLILPPEMSEEERNLVRKLRQDPFARRSYAPKIHNLEESIAGTQWRISARVEREAQADEDAPRNSASPRTLKTLHRGIQVLPVGRMQEDISFRVINAGPPSSLSSPRRGVSDVTSHRGAQFQRHQVGSARGFRSSSPYSGDPSTPRTVTTGFATPHSKSPRQHHHQSFGRHQTLVDGGHGRGYASDADLQRAVATFNELKKKAVLLDRIPTSVEVLTPEMFVRIEDDFLRATKGRKSRVLMSEDFTTSDIKLGGNIFTKRRLEFLMTKDDGGGGVAFVPLFQYAFPYVSSAQIDRYMLQHSTSMNKLLGGPLEVRAEPAVYRAIHSFYEKFDVDGDGVVFVQDIVRQQQKLYDQTNPNNVSGGGGPPSWTTPSSAPLSSQQQEGGVIGGDGGFEAASLHINADPDGRVSLEEFAMFARFLFPPYKALEVNPHALPSLV
ncbi:Hypothetical protein, putative [Bodo saltans]|uniref:Uncharacterized protein n=1 Tax=Bodo saltans TaxID=75058 RepID=A0A0S4IR40_BODSA|nr:Hypothetical protein, putative [Bodo saltans]|eukprot:CUG00105.1 Hypothetical protein, putative [Bodo saltans]